MKVNVEEIESILKRLITNEVSRDTASNWAMKLIDADENDTLDYYPEHLTELIWEAILFIQGIDLQDRPGVYLHSLIDIKQYLASIESSH